MKHFKCINNNAMTGILTVNKIYEGDYQLDPDYIDIYKCDDGTPNNGFYANRFIETPAPEIKIFKQINPFEIEIK